jgi:hypothetical protein
MTISSIKHIHQNAKAKTNNPCRIRQDDLSMIRSFLDPFFSKPSFGVCFSERRCVFFYRHDKTTQHSKEYIANFHHLMSCTSKCKSGETYRREGERKRTLSDEAALNLRVNMDNQFAQTELFYP